MTKNKKTQTIYIQIKKYSQEKDWKIWIKYKEEIKLESLKLELSIYNELMDYVSGLKTNFSGENKLKIFELWAMLSNNKVYIEK